MPEVTADEALRRLQAGEPMIACRAACLDAWRANRATALVLNETRRWTELAVLVMDTGYTDDLTYFYLGRAAEGLGYRDAAKIYYQVSARLSAAGLACIKENPDLCNGQRLPAAAEARLTELTAPPPPPAKTPSRRQPPQHRPSATAPKHARPASAPLPQTKPSAPTGSAVVPEAGDKATEPDFAAPPPIRR